MIMVAGILLATMPFLNDSHIKTGRLPTSFFAHGGLAARR